MALFLGDFTSTLIVALGLTAAYLVGTIIYRTKIDPLSSYPGPTICALTRLPFWWAYTRGYQATWIRRLHAIYGPVVRYGPTELSYIDKAAWKDIYGYKKGGNEVPKDLAYLPDSPNGADNIIVADHEPHARFRRAFSTAFTEKAVRQQEPLFQKYANLMVAKLDAAGGRPLDLAKMFNFVTFDTMADLTFGEPLGLLETGAYTEWVASVFASVSLMPLHFLLKFYPLLRMLHRWLEPPSVAARRLANFRYSAVRVDRRLARGPAPGQAPDIWALTLGADKDHPALSLAEMHNNSELLMIAGTETTSTWLSGFVFLLLRNPDKMARLRAEIESAAAGPDAEDDGRVYPLPFDRLASLSYLNACLDEALRLYPPAPLGQTRIVTQPEGRDVMGRWVPPGTTVSVHHLAAYRSPANFKNPERFVPERWLGDPEYAADQREVFKPFSYGPRNCLGQRMAYHESRLLAAQLLYNFDLELCDKTRDWMDQRVYILWDKTPLMCSVRRRGEKAPVAPAWQSQTETV